MARLDVGSLGSYIREQRTSAELSIRELARVAGVSNPYLSQVERGIRQPSAQTLSRVADALRISAEQLYVRAGFLERGHEHSVRAALAEDELLTDTQRRDLIDRYEAYIAANAARPNRKTTRPTTKPSSLPKKTTTKKTTAARGGSDTKPDSTSRRTERGSQ